MQVKLGGHVWNGKGWDETTKIGWINAMKLSETKK